MSKILTRREYLQKLPLQKRLQAMEAIRKYAFEGMCVLSDFTHSDSILGGAFVFKKTKQGHSYWWNINAKYFSNVK